MKKINRQATAIFCKLLKKLKGQQHLKVQVDGFMPLTLQCIGDQITTAWGVAKLYSLSHHYVLNGDLMRDPEVCFIVVDNRQNEKDYDLIGIYPQMYQQDNLGIYEESIHIVNNTVTRFNKIWQKGHCSFSNMWMKNIKAQGFLN